MLLEDKVYNIIIRLVKIYRFILISLLIGFNLRYTSIIVDIIDKIRAKVIKLKVSKLYSKQDL